MIYLTKIDLLNPPFRFLSGEFREARRRRAFEQGFSDGPTFAVVQRLQILLPAPR